MRRFALCLVVGALLCSGALFAQNGSVIVAEGFSAPNNYPVDQLPAWFAGWCADSEDGFGCFPTVRLEVTDVKKTKAVGYIYAWGKDFKDQNGTLQFKEFILYDLDGGQLYTLSQDGGHPGGAFTDPTLIPPKEADVVLVGGAEGVVMGGAGKYAGASGAYSTRLKVELDFASGLFTYYDELYFRFREVRIEE